MNQQNFNIPSQFLSAGQQHQQQLQQQPYGSSPPPYNPTYGSPQYAPPSTQQQQQYNNPLYNTNVPVVAAAPVTAPSYMAGNNNTTSNANTILQNALGETERLIIQQEIEYVEAAANLAANAMNVDALGRFGEQANRYNIFTDNGGKQFHVVETSHYCMRVCCRPNHELQLHVFLPPSTQGQQPGQADQKVMVMDRPWKCGYCCACADICQQEMKVYQGDIQPDSPDPSRMIGYIKQPRLGGMFSPKLNVMDREGGQTIATIQAEAKCCIGGMCCNHTFWVKDPQGNYMGKIVKERPGNLAQIAKELTTDADNFTMYVPKEMNVQHKANMLAALHLIDYMFFENEGDLNLDVRNQKCSYKCCDFYCFGCVFPFHLTCQRSCCGGKKDKIDNDSNNNGYQQTQANGYTTSNSAQNNNNNNKYNHGHQHHDHDHHHGPGRGHCGPGHGPGRGHHDKHHHPPPHHDHHHHHHHGHHP